MHVALADFSHVDSQNYPINFMPEPDPATVFPQALHEKAAESAYVADGFTPPSSPGMQPALLGECTLAPPVFGQNDMRTWKRARPSEHVQSGAGNSVEFLTTLADPHNQHVSTHAQLADTRKELADTRNELDKKDKKLVQTQRSLDMTRTQLSSNASKFQQDAKTLAMHRQIFREQSEAQTAKIVKLESRIDWLELTIERMKAQAALPRPAVTTARELTSHDSSQPISADSSTNERKSALTVQQYYKPQTPHIEATTTGLPDSGPIDADTLDGDLTHWIGDAGFWDDLANEQLSLADIIQFDAH